MRPWHAPLLAAVAAAGCSGHREPDGDRAGATAAPAPAPGSSAASGAPPVRENPPRPRPPARGPEHAVYSLVDNRLAAHLERDGGLLVPAGSAGIAKYLRFGNTRRGRERVWELRQTDDGVPTAHMIGKTARLDVPLTAAQLEPPVVRVRVWSAKDEPFGVRVNGNAELAGTAAAGWSTVELAVPAGQLVAGEDELVLAARTAGHPVAWIELGGAHAPAPAGDATAFYDPAARALVVPGGGGMAWYAFVPEHARLTGDVADPACTIAVHAIAEDGATAGGTLAGAGGAVDLSALAGKAARVELAAAGCAKAEIADAAIAIPGAAPVAPARGPAPRYVVLFIMDALRADRVRPFNPDARPETPEWQALARTGAVFLQHYVQGNESRVSHSSIWTSLYPIKHGFMDAGGALSPRWKTVDKVAKDAGMFVAGVSANGYIRPSRGFGSAWNRFSNHIEEEGGLTAAEVIAHGLSFVDKKKDPWFLYLGTIDTHVTWRARQPWMATYDPKPYSGRFAKSFAGDDADRAPGQPDPYGVITDREREHIRAIYDSDVSYQDDQLRQLVEKLQAWGVWDQTMLIVTADHGDELWEDGDRVGHGWSVRDMLVHVPLLVHYPPMIPAGAIGEGTECIDLVPTIADALGVAQDPEWQGQSLIPLAGGVGRGYPRLSVASMFEDEHGPRLAQWKMDVRGTGTPRLYDLAHDPDEHRDLWGQPGAEIGARFVLDPTWTLRTFNLDWKKARWGNAADVSAQFASDLGE